MWNGGHNSHQGHQYPYYGGGYPPQSYPPASGYPQQSYNHQPPGYIQSPMYLSGHGSAGLGGGMPGYGSHQGYGHSHGHSGSAGLGGGMPGYGSHQGYGHSHGHSGGHGGYAHSGGGYGMTHGGGHHGKFGKAGKMHGYKKWK